MENKNLLIGLDIGTDSVGWAATDENFDLYRIKGKDAWGARIFDAAEPAKNRRLKRTNKRRVARRAYRIKLLNQLFWPFIKPIDESFFIRLAESNLHLPDKSVCNKYLFLTRELEKQFYLKYPTIWHLRNALYNNNQGAFSDIRFLYLAIHHIIKYRGNFLLDGEFDRTFDETIFDKINNFFKELMIEIDEDSEEFILLDKDNIQNFIDVLKKDETKTTKKKELKKLFSPSDEKMILNYEDFLVTILTGGEFDVSKIDKDSFASCKVCFNSSYDEKEPEIQSILGDKFDIVRFAKVIFDYFQLEGILGNHKNISSAFSTIYDTHKCQLNDLKKMCKSIDNKFSLTKQNSTYFKIFKDKTSEDNYCALVGNNNNQKRSGVPKEFCKFVENTIKPYSDYLNSYPGYNVLKDLIEKESLLDVIANKSTSSIPNQLHKYELIKILDNASVFFPDIKEIKDKIIAIFEYKIPYYYGPLDDRSKYSSVVRKSNQTVTPWNINEVIDDDETRKNFINSLTNSCQYLLDQNSVLPKCSLLYQKYIILNRLHTLQINGTRISKHVRDNLYNNLILKKQKTTLSQIEKFLKNEYNDYSKDGVVISGINKNDDFINSSRYFFCNFFAVSDLNKEQENIAEKIIFYFSIFTDNVNDAIKAVKKDIINLTDNQIKVLKTMSFKGWSPFSRKLLTGIKISDDNGVYYSIIESMEENIKNFQEVLYDEKMNFNDAIKQYNFQVCGTKDTDELVNEIIESTPPKMRRSVIQAVRIVDEIVALSKKTPKYISIEVTRENDVSKKGKETSSREKTIRKFIESLKKDKEQIFKEDDISKIEKDLNDLKETNQLEKLRNKHIYLYFMQCGKDLYTNKSIEINEVINGNKYDTDHIIPQRLIKDDSLDNLVLVNKDDNEKNKGGYYPLPDNILANSSVRKLWKYLHTKKHISDKKYNNLIRTKPLTNEELSGFVNAQINVVNHSNIAIRDILQIKYPNTTLIFSKAQYPSFIRKKYEIAKLRELNDSHHAVDAYLNVVAGVILYNTFSSKFWLKEDVKDHENESMNMEKAIERYLNKDELFKKIREKCFKHSPLLTYRNIYQEAEFHKETIHKHSDGNLIPVHEGKMADTSRYGGYEELKTTYFLVAEAEKKKKNEKKLVPVSWLDVKKYTSNKLKEKIQMELGDNIAISDRKIQLNQKINYHGAEYLLMSANKIVVNLKPVNPLYLTQEHTLYLSKFIKYKEVLKDCADSKIEICTNKEKTKFVIFDKNTNLDILNYLIARAENSIFDACSMISNIRSYKEDENITEFSSLTIYEQLEQILNIIYLFGRNSRNSKNKPNQFLKTFNVIDDDSFTIKYESITGLISYTKKI